MKSFSYAKALIAVSLLAVVPLACGDDENKPKPSPSQGGEPGAGGSDGRAGDVSTGASNAMGGAPMLPPGISTEPSTIECGGDCSSAEVNFVGTSFYIDPCCAEAEACGLGTTFLAAAGAMFSEACQPKDQPGEEDEACPASPPAMVPYMDQTVALDAFVGCCRPNGTCGVLVNEVKIGGVLSLGDLELGCVDAAPFFPDEDPVPCGEGAGGGNAGGSGNGGEPAVGGDGAGGASGGAGG